MRRLIGYTLMLVATATIKVVAIKEFEKELYGQLLATYESLARPVEKATDPVNVSLGIALQQIVDIVEKEQMIVLNVWLTFQWYDYRLRWDPTEHGNITQLRLPPGKVWKPDVLLYNGAGENFDPIYQCNVIIKHTGQLEWIPPGIIKATCKIDITWFPFDDQVCDLKYGSWTFSGYMLLLDVGEVNIATYTELRMGNGHYVTPIRNEFKYDCCPDPYYDVTFRIYVRRRTLYYLCNMILPCVLISFMTLLDFTLPPESGEKLGLGVIIFMTLCFFLITTSNTLPQTSEAVPLIVIYFSAIMVVVSASVVFTVLVLNIHHRKSEAYSMGKKFRTVFIHFLPWLLMMKRPGYVSIRGRLVPIGSDMPSTTRVSKSPAKTTAVSLLDIDDLKFPMKGVINGYSVLVNNPSMESEFEGRSVVDSVDCSGDLSALTPGSPEEAIATHLLPVLLRLFADIQVVTSHLDKEADERSISEDWKFAAMVVDRLSLIMFTSILVVSTLAILFQAPHTA